MTTFSTQVLPKARVNITVDVETGGAKQRKELPFKCLFLGDFSPQVATTIPLSEQIIYPLNASNFDTVLANLSPQLKFSVANRIQPQHGDLSVQLSFKQIADFHPDKLITQTVVKKKITHR